MLTKPLALPRLPPFLDRLLQDPPPQWVVEFSEAGVFRASTGDPVQTHLEAIPGGALSASPLELNVKDYAAVEQAVAKLGLRPAEHQETGCALILPDYCVRVSILEFEEFPSSREEQEPLIRFRLRKIVPYDLDSARLSFQVYGRGSGASGVTVLASLCPMHVLAEYESLLRGAGCHPGYVTSSALAALELLPADSVSVMAKLSGRVATVAASQAGAPRLFRTVELMEVSWDELLSLLQPTFALVEDQLNDRVQEVWLAGFEDDAAALARTLSEQFGVRAEAVISALGAPHEYSAGAYGYLQGIREMQG